MGLGFFKSSANAFKKGLNVGLGSFGKINDTKGIGSTLTLGVAGAAIGAGAAIASSNGAVDPVNAGLVGGAIGATALPAAGLFVGGMGNAGVKAIKGIGSSLYNGGPKVVSAVAPTVATVGLGVAANFGESLFKFSRRMVDWDDAADSINKVRFTKPISGAKAAMSRNPLKHIDVKTNWRDYATNARYRTRQVGSAVGGFLFNGATIIGAATVAEGVKDAWGEFKRQSMGQMTGIVTNTPRVPSYSNNAGATGDLVFAMNANRRG